MTIQLRGICLTLAGAVLAAMLAACSKAPPGTYATPEEAVQELRKNAGSGDAKKAEEMFGADALDMFQSGDDVADHEDAMRVKAMIQEKSRSRISTKRQGRRGRQRGMDFARSRS